SVVASGSLVASAPVVVVVDVVVPGPVVTDDGSSVVVVSVPVPVSVVSATGITGPASVSVAAMPCFSLSIHATESAVARYRTTDFRISLERWRGRSGRHHQFPLIRPEQCHAAPSRAISPFHRHPHGPAPRPGRGRTDVIHGVAAITLARTAPRPRDAGSCPPSQRSRPPA